MSTKVVISINFKKNKYQMTDIYRWMADHKYPISQRINVADGFIEMIMIDKKKVGERVYVATPVNHPDIAVVFGYLR